ncbi:MAG: Holliday junction branch migration protein RuvA [Pseudomonadota bacterium]|nr:Holliday junction branch migration protein RuvA [Pseudomonadota bacterium]
MIAKIQGKLLDKTDQQIVIDVSGLGYEVSVPTSTRISLGPIDSLVSLYTHLVVREDAQILFGFLEKQDRELFRALIRVNKIGPKLAVAILSAVDARAFISCIRQNDIKTLNGISGVGKVMAERLIMEMRDKFTDWQVGLDDRVGVPAKSEGRVDAEAAIVGLGFKPQEAARALAQIEDDSDDVQVLVRQALKLLA